MPLRVPSPDHGARHPGDIGKLAFLSVDQECAVLAPQRPRSVHVQAVVLGGDVLGVLPHLHQLLGVEDVQIHQGGDLIVQVLDQSRRK